MNSLLYKLHTDYFSMCQSVILSVLTHEEIYLNICRNVRGVLTFMIHCIYIEHYILLWKNLPHNCMFSKGYLLPKHFWPYFWSSQTPDDNKKYGQKCLGRRYGTIPFPSRSQYKKNNKETWKYKIRNNKQCSIIFNKTCLNNNLLPKYTIFKKKIIYICTHIHVS